MINLSVNRPKSLADWSFEVQSYDTVNDVRPVAFTSIETESVVSWFWDFGDGSFSEEKNPTHNYDVGFARFVTVTLAVRDLNGSKISETKNLVVGGQHSSDAYSVEPLVDRVFYLDSYEPLAGTGLFLGFLIPDPLPGEELVIVSSITEDLLGSVFPFNFGRLSLQGPDSDGELRVNSGWNDHETNTSSISPHRTLDTDVNVNQFSSPLEPGVWWIKFEKLGRSKHFVLNFLFRSFVDQEVKFYPRIWGHLTIKFEDYSIPREDGSISKWEWDFGDGNTSTEQNPTHVYDAAGSYLTSLTITDDLGSQQTLKLVADVYEMTQVFPGQTLEGVVIPSKSTNPPPDGSEFPRYKIFYMDVEEATKVNIESTTISNDHTRVVVGQKGHSPYNSGAGTVGSFDFPYEATKYRFVEDRRFDTGETINLSSKSSSLLFDDPTEGGGRWYFAISNTDEEAEEDDVLDLTFSKSGGLTANFSYSRIGRSFSFKDESLPYNKFLRKRDAIDWEWDFGDGNVSTDQNPHHVYDSEGEYLVRLTIRDKRRFPVFTEKKVTAVKNEPTSADFEHRVSSGLFAEFFDRSTDDDAIAEWLWDFGDGNSSTERNPTHTYASAGTYTVQLQVTGDSQVNISRDIHVPDLIELSNGVANTSVNAPAGEMDHFYIDVPEGKVNLSFSLQDHNVSSRIFVDTDPNTLDATSFFSEFNFEDEFASVGDVAQIDVVNPEPTRWYIRIKASSSSNSITQGQVTASYEDSTVKAEFTHSRLGLVFYFEDESSHVLEPVGVKPIQWSWDFGDGFTSSDRNPVHGYASAGQYTVTLTVTASDGTTDMVQHTVDPVVNELPVAGFDFSVNQDTLETSFTDTSTDLDGDIVSWSWDFGDGNTSTEQHPVHTYSAEGDYQAQLTVEDDFGDTDTVIKTVKVGIEILDQENQTEITNGQTLVANDQDRFYAIIQGSGVSNINVVLTSGGGDPDLYLRWGALPTTSSYDQRGFTSGGENLNVTNNPDEDVLYIYVNEFSSFSDADLTITWDE